VTEVVVSERASDPAVVLRTELRHVRREVVETLGRVGLNQSGVPGQSLIKPLQPGHHTRHVELGRAPFRPFTELFAVGFVAEQLGERVSVRRR